jgi:hypothetical protein
MIDQIVCPQIVTTTVGTGTQIYQHGLVTHAAAGFATVFKGFRTLILLPHRR